MKKVNVYVCYTVYHVFAAVLMATEKQNMDNRIVFTDFIADKEMIKKIEESNFFTKAYVIKEKELFKDLYRSASSLSTKVKNKVFQTKIERQMLEPFQFEKYWEYYLFFDDVVLSRYFMRNYPHVFYVEDAPLTMKNQIKRKKTIKKSILNTLGMSFDIYGHDKRIKTVYTGVTEELPTIISKKAKYFYYKDVLKRLSEDERERIKGIFLTGEVTSLEGEGPKMLVLTQPWSEFGFCTEEEKVTLYQRIVANNQVKYPNHTLYIKKHPRDLTDYHATFKDAVYIDSQIPFEVLELIKENGLFDVGITINSSAIYSDLITNKITLGVTIDMPIYQSYQNKFEVSSQS